MDSLDLALQRYEQLRQSTARFDSAQNGESLSDWVQRYVCPVIGSLLRRDDFRQLARWSVDNLSAGSTTAARRLIDNIDDQLVESARRLRELIQPITQLTAIDSESRSAQQRPSEPIEEDAAGSVADFIATRPWRDLVAVVDYFSPAAELNLRDRKAWLGPDTDHVSIGEFTPFLRPHLYRFGDHVVEALFMRVNYWRERLQRHFVRCDTAIRSRSDISPETKEEFRQAALDITEPIHELEAILRHDELAHLRTTCVKLVQVYTAFNPAGDFEWLGIARNVISNAGYFRYQIEKRADSVLADQIAGALVDVAEFYRREPDVDAMIAENVRSHRLVLIHGRGYNHLYWQQELIEIDPQSREWTLMVGLAEAAVHGRGLDQSDELGISLKDARYGLKSLLPPELLTLIKAVGGGYRLKIPREELFVARVEECERLFEIT